MRIERPGREDGMDIVRMEMIGRIARMERM